MASKKSAKSKGYRKTAQKKPYLTKKEIIITCIIAAVIILAFVLMNVLYTDGSLKLVDGVPQVEGEHSILINTGTGNSPRYFKLGQAGEAEGYTLEEAESSADANIKNFTYTPDGESFVDSVSLGGYPASAENYANYISSWYGAIEGYDVSEVKTTQIGGKDIPYLTATTDPEVLAATIAAAQEAVEETTEEAEEAVEETAEAAEEAVEENAEAAGEAVEETAEEAAEAVEEAAEEAAEDVEETAEDDNGVGYMQELIAYVPSGDYCIAIHVINEADSAEGYVDDEALIGELETIMAGLTYETR